MGPWLWYIPVPGAPCPASACYPVPRAPPHHPQPGGISLRQDRPADGEFLLSAPYRKNTRFHRLTDRSPFSLLPRQSSFCPEGPALSEGPAHNVPAGTATSPWGRGCFSAGPAGASPAPYFPADCRRARGQLVTCLHRRSGRPAGQTVSPPAPSEMASNALGLHHTATHARLSWEGDFWLCPHSPADMAGRCPGGSATW